MEYQISIFDDIPQEDDKDIRWAVRGGNCVEGGKLRMYVAYLTMSRTDLIAFLPEEYGIGGFCEAGMPMVMFDHRGITLIDRDNLAERLYRWPMVADILREEIGSGRYMDEKTERQHQALQKRLKGNIRPPIARYGWREMKD